jgi:hypothetical protein
MACFSFIETPTRWCLRCAVPELERRVVRGEVRPIGPISLTTTTNPWKSIKLETIARGTIRVPARKLMPVSCPVQFRVRFGRISSFGHSSPGSDDAVCRRQSGRRRHSLALPGTTKPTGSALLRTGDVEQLLPQPHVRRVSTVRAMPNRIDVLLWQFNRKRTRGEAEGVGASRRGRLTEDRDGLDLAQQERNSLDMRSLVNYMTGSPQLGQAPI